MWIPWSSISRLRTYYFLKRLRSPHSHQPDMNAYVPAPVASTGRHQSCKFLLIWAVKGQISYHVFISHLHFLFCEFPTYPLCVCIYIFLLEYLSFSYQFWKSFIRDINLIFHLCGKIFPQLPFVTWFNYVFVIKLLKLNDLFPFWFCVLDLRNSLWC